MHEEDASQEPCDQMLGYNDERSLTFHENRNYQRRVLRFHVTKLHQINAMAN